VVFALGGGSAHRNATSPPETGSRRTHSHSSRSAHSSHLPAGAAARGETSVTVLNGTETTGLAHRTASQLQQDGYSRATAVSGQPPGSNQTTAVEYSSGHKADAEGIAQALGVTQTQPLESTVAALAPSASVVVVVGQDKASTSGP
jgi:LytR cell envelope-related transcriptional attenuator